METPQVQALPGMTPLGIPENLLHHRLITVLVKYDKAQERIETRRGARVNIHRIAILLKALEDAESHPEGIMAGLLQCFTVSRLQTKLLKIVS